MKTIIKRLSVIVPVVFMLLLSCLSSGAALADDFSDISTDYNAFSNSKYPEFPIASLRDYYDKDILRSAVISDYDDNYRTHPYYFYEVYFNIYNSECYLRANLFFIDDSTIVMDAEHYVEYNLSSAYFFSVKLSSTYIAASSLSSSNASNPIFFCYNKSNGGGYTAESTYIPSLQSKDLFYEETNLPDFPYCEKVAHSSGSSALDVSVSFSPDLSGVVDTTILDHGVKTESKYFNMTLLNHSSTSLQYFLCIVDHGYDVFSNNSFGASSYGSSVHYILIRDEWFAAYQSGQDHAIKSYGSCEWHPCAVGSASLQTISWSQMKLFADFSYDVVVYAIPLDDSSTVNLYIDSYQGFDLNIQEVYRSSFSLKKKTNFDPNDDTRGNLPFVTGQEPDRDQIYQYYDSDGQLQVAANGKRFTRDDVYNNDYNGSSINHSGYFNQSSSNFASLSSSITGYLSFFNRVWSYFPYNFTALISLAITSLVVIAIFKGVFK